MKTRVLTKQVRRAVDIENLLMATLFDHLAHGYTEAGREPTDTELALCAGTVHYILGRSIVPQVKALGPSSYGEAAIRSRASEMLVADPELERLVVRLLYEIASLANMLKKDAWVQEFAANHPRMMEILGAARAKHLELLGDPAETEFRQLFSRFLKKYDPERAVAASQLFP